MAKEEIPLPGFAGLSQDERNYFDKRGDTAQLASQREPEPQPDLTPPEPPAEPPVEPEQPAEPAEPIDDVTAPEGEVPGLDEGEVQPGEPVPDDTGRPPRTAPIQALQAERERRQNAERVLQQREQELLQHREWRARIDERLRVLNEQRQFAQQTQQPGPPDRNEDPEGYRDYVDQQREQRIAALEQHIQALQQGGREGQLMTSVAAMTQSFAAQTPDYHQAVGGLRQKLEEDLVLGGYDDPTERATMINAWSEPIIRKALARGMNPAEAVYKIAKARVGTPPVQPAGAVAPPSNAGRVANIRRGQQATRSLGRGSTAPMADGLTLQRLLDASPQEFARYMAEQPAVVNALMGK